MTQIIANPEMAADNRARMIRMLCFAFMFSLLAAGLLVPGMVSASTPITSCGDCHGNPPVDNPAGTGRTPADGRFEGTHNTHAGAWYTTTDSRYGFSCEICHASPLYTAYNHQNDNIQVNLRWMSLAGGAIQGGSVAGWGSYSKGTSFAQLNMSTFGVCENTYCHSNGSGGTQNAGDPRTISANISPRWGTNTPGGPGCTPCHGRETGNPGNGAPWYTTTGNGNGSAGRKANSHQVHAGTGNPCNKCHYNTTNTGNTITSVGNHIKGTYNVTPNTGAGISFTYSYATNGGTCSTASCHGNASPRWGSGSWDCIGCHSGSFRKTLGIGTIRRVVGGDFNMSTIGNGAGSRHLYGATTIVKWDCIICHREGSETTGKANGTYHNDASGLIHLRNVDTYDEAQGWSINNKTWTSASYADLDQFCVACHDANGSAAISVNNTNNGLLWGSVGGGWSTRSVTAKTTNLQPFNTTDVSNGKISASSESASAARVRVINVKDQFFAGHLLAHRITATLHSMLSLAGATRQYGRIGRQQRG